jgi:hypothetical protein
MGGTKIRAHVRQVSCPLPNTPPQAGYRIHTSWLPNLSRADSLGED